MYGELILENQSILNRSCRTFENKWHQNDIATEKCLECGMTFSEITEERSRHLNSCIREAFGYDNPEFHTHGSREKEDRYTEESRKKFLTLFRGPVRVSSETSEPSQVKE